MRSAALVVVLVLAAARPAEGYPQFQLATGAARCNQCHYAPAGGGLINGYGRDEAADSISMGGYGDFLHGVWELPSWLGLGGDLRAAGLVNNVGATDGAELTAFPMQADLYARVAVEAFSLYVSAGITGAVRPEADFVDRLVSREHYLMWRPKSVGPYLRVGRFFAPYGLRLAEHLSFVRRFLGFNTLEETYNLAGGVVNDGWELHATAFTPDPFRPVGFEGSGGAVYYERRFGETFAAAAQARFAIASGDTRTQGGLVGKLYLEPARTLLLVQTDLVHERFDETGASRLQWVYYLGASWRFARGFMVQLMLERWDPDLATRGVARDALDLEVQWFPTAHVEVSLFGRLQLIGPGSDDSTGAQVLMLQAHYYL